MLEKRTPQQQQKRQAFGSSSKHYCSGERKTERRRKKLDNILKPVRQANSCLRFFYTHHMRARHPQPEIYVYHIETDKFPTSHIYYTNIIFHK